MLTENIKYSRQFITIVIIGMIFASCSLGSVYKRKGLELLNSGQYDKAIKYYEELLIKKPSNSSLITLLKRAKLYGYYFHVAKARSMRKTGKRDLAIKEYKKALSILPYDNELSNELKTYVVGKKEEKHVSFKSDIEPPVLLKIDGKKIDSVSLMSTPIKQIFKTVGKSYGINFIFDKDFRDFSYTFDVENIGFFEILNQLCLISNTKYKIVDSSSVLIYPNTSYKKRAFDLKGVKIFYLTNAAAEDVKKMILPLFRDERIQIQEDRNLNAVIVKGNSNSLKSIEKFIRKIDKAKSEVEFDIEILEINRKLLNKIGADFGKTISSMSIGTEKEDGGVNSVINIKNLKQSNFFLKLPTIALNILGTDDDSKIIAKPNLRGIHGEEIKFMVGDEIPIPITSFQAMAAGGVQNTPVTNYNYKNVGVEIKLTPYVHKGEVTVKLKLTMNFVTSYVDQFPVLGKRELETLIRLKEGESSIVGGFIKDEVRGKLKGIPLLSKLPVIGRLFGSSEDTVKQTDIIFSITPKFIREVDDSEESRMPIWIGNDLNEKLPGEHSEPLRNGVRRNSINRRKNNSISISPSRIRVMKNTSSVFYLKVNSESPISTLSISGNITGGNVEIEYLNTDVISDKKVKVLKSHSASTFDIGYSFFNRPITHSTIGTIKIKFLEKGNYKINFSNIYASSNKKQINIIGSNTEITVY